MARDLVKPLHTYVHELRVVTKRIWLWMQAAKMSFLRWVAGLSLIQGKELVWSSGGVRLEPLLLCGAYRGVLGSWLGSRHLFWRFSQHAELRNGPHGRQRVHWRDYIFFYGKLLPHLNKAYQSTLLLDCHTTNNTNIAYISSLHNLSYTF